jgi:hypothetical protein
MLQGGGKMRLIMGCQFSSNDLQAIQQGYALRDALLTRLDAELKPAENFAQLKHFEILSWLIQNNYLDIKIAIPLKDNGLPEDSTKQLDPQHIFHEKVGIFTDTNGDQLAFNGSNNESIGGWELNVESFHVYCSWEGGRELDRVQEEISRFEQLWYDLAPNVCVFEVPEAVQKKLLRYAPTSKPKWNPQVEFDTRPIEKNDNINRQDACGTRVEEEKTLFKQLASIHEHPGCLDFCLKSIPIKPWIHQIKILRRVAEKFPHSFLIADPEEEDVLMSDFESVIEAPLGRLSIEEMTTMDLEADIAEIQKPIAPSPFQPESIEQMFTTSVIFNNQSILFTRIQDKDKVWQLLYKGNIYNVTFYPNVFDAQALLKINEFWRPLV